MIFYYSNCNIISFFCYVKNYLEILYVSINTYYINYILLYVSIDFLIHKYIFYMIYKKNINNTYTSILLC